MSTDTHHGSIISIASPSSFKLFRHQKNPKEYFKLIPRKPTTFKAPSTASYVGPYEIGQAIGEGAYSTVYVVRRDEKLYAMKVVWKEDVPKNSKMRISPLKEVQNELKALNLMAKSSNSNLVRLYDTFTSRTKVYFITSLGRGGSLANHIPASGLTEDQARTYIIQLLNAIATLHEIGIVHRDIKLDNIILDEHGDIMLTDMGLCSVATPATIAKHKLYSRVGSPHYVAPEVIYLVESGYYAAPTDIWSAGVCFFAMLTGTLPFNSSDTQQLYTLIKACRYNFPAYCKASISSKSFLSLMLDADPFSRATITDLVKHSFISSHIMDVLGLDCALFRVLEDLDIPDAPVSTMTSFMDKIIVEHDLAMTSLKTY